MKTVHQSMTPKQLHLQWETRPRACTHCLLVMVLHNINLVPHNTHK